MGDLLGYLRLLKTNNQPLSKSDAIKIIIEIAKGAAYLEMIGMIHRYIKILLSARLSVFRANIFNKA